MRKILLLGIGVFCFSMSAQALDPFNVFQKKAPENCIDKDILNGPVGLPELLEIGLCNNPALNRGYMEVKSREASFGASKAEYLPSLTLKGDLTDTYNKVEDYSSQSQNPYRANAALSWMLYDFGGRSARVKRAENYMLSSGFEYNAWLRHESNGVKQHYHASETTTINCEESDN